MIACDSLSARCGQKYADNPTNPITKPNLAFLISGLTEQMLLLVKQAQTDTAVCQNVASGKPSNKYQSGYTREVKHCFMKCFRCHSADITDCHGFNLQPNFPITSYSCDIHLLGIQMTAVIS